jgi:hypothetical protein
LVADIEARLEREAAAQRWREEASKEVIRRPERLAWVEPPK